MYRLDTASFIFVFVFCAIIGLTVVGFMVCVLCPLERTRDFCLRCACKEKGKLIFQTRRRMVQVEPESEPETRDRNAYFRNDDSIAEVI